MKSADEINLFSIINWGEDEAKGDRNLEYYFVPIPEFEGLMEGRFNYIIGRKGTGKTAIIEQIKSLSNKDALSFQKYLSLRSFPLPVLRELRDKNLRDKSQFVPIWSFLILVELARMIAADENAGPAQTKYDLSKFLDKNFPNGTSFTSTLTRLEKTNHTVSIFPNWLGGKSEQSSDTANTGEIHFQACVELLLHRIQGITSSSKYFILIDELDEGFRSTDSFLRLLILALLRSIESLSQDFRETGVQLRPIAALRSDIFDRLEDNDLNKLDDRLVRLNWGPTEQSPHRIQDLITARIVASSTLKHEHAWDAIFSSKSRGESAFDYILARTYVRPRDVIKYLKYCQRNQHSGALSLETAIKAEASYSQWFHNEFRDEVQSFLPVWRYALHALPRVNPKAVGKFEWLRNQLESEPEITQWCRKENKRIADIIDILFDYSVIGSIDRAGRVSYKYLNPDASWRLEDGLTVHKGFRKYLRMSDPTVSDIESIFKHTRSTPLNPPQIKR